MNKKKMYVYCRDDVALIENYDKAKEANFKGWVVHHRLETHNKFGKKRDEDVRVAVLISLGLYYNRPANELIFLTKEEHMNLHSTGYSHNASSTSFKKGHKTWNKGIKQTEEVKAKISASCKEAYKNLPDEVKARMNPKGRPAWNKGGTSPNKGRRCYTDGVHRLYLYSGDIIPDGYYLGSPKLSEQTRQKMRHSQLRRRIGEMKKQWQN